MKKYSIIFFIIILIMSLFLTGCTQPEDIKEAKNTIEENTDLNDNDEITDLTDEELDKLATTAVNIFENINNQVPKTTRRFDTSYSIELTSDTLTIKGTISLVPPTGLQIILYVEYINYVVPNTGCIIKSGKSKITINATDENNFTATFDGYFINNCVRLNESHKYILTIYCVNGDISSEGTINGYHVTSAIG